MNYLGQSCRPFIFIINYQQDASYIEAVSSVDPAEILYNLNGFTNQPMFAENNIAFLSRKRLRWQSFPESLATYQHSFDIVQRNIFAGNSFLTNLTCRTPVETNLTLKDIYCYSKAMYKLWVRDAFTVFSPEIFIRIHNGRIYSYPMKGTINASTPSADRLLINDPKETAEHATIVDLIRNDLSMVAEQVSVSRYRYIDKLQTNQGSILQTSSEIQGVLPDDYLTNLGSIIFRLLPAGSITGAPKKKTMQIIKEAETYDRGFYTGIMGYFDGKDLDSAVMIRFVEQEGGKMYFKSGGGITSQSDVENEYNEIDHKFVATDIPLDDPGVMSLFHDTSALGIKPEDIGGCPVGCLGIPEFGTDFVIQMVVDTKPKSLSDLIRISGLSHGTDVWLNNAQELIRSGKATISTAICTRDDIMTYLINKGMDSEESFTIMERVRKGTVAKGKCKEWPDFKKDMAEHDVPDWYIWSCEKIKYMFPKAHAAAYVMMAYRIAYCKINYPLAYYGAYFGIRADAFSYEIMCQGKEKLQYYINDYNRRSATLSKKEQDTMKDMHIVQEMYARGYEFLPIDIYKAKATKFQIIDGKLMPPFSSIDGMGEKAAEGMEEAAKDGPYLSRDDFRQRTKASKTVIDYMGTLGLLGDLPESNQLSLFDL